MILGIDPGIYGALVTKSKIIDPPVEMYGDGSKPDVERVDNDLGYSPDNCILEIRKNNCRNKRNNKLITYNGETLSFCEVRDKYAPLMDGRKDAIQTPVRRK